MATIKLTDPTWIEQEAAKVAGVLRQALGGSEGKPGRDGSELRAIVEYAMGPGYYTNPDLAAIRDRLVAGGVIEIIA
jgi:hypothetical protein